MDMFAGYKMPDIWKDRFMWLWKHSEEGFWTPDGWQIYYEDCREEDLKNIDKWIADEKAKTL